MAGVDAAPQDAPAVGQHDSLPNTRSTFSLVIPFVLQQSCLKIPVDQAVA